MNVSLKELIKTGRLGSVQLGMSRAQVESCLGPPDDVGGTSRKHQRPSIWKYGDFELHFARGSESLFLIHLDDFEVPSGGNLYSFDPWIIRHTLTLPEAEKHLLQSGINYEVEHFESEDNAKWLVAGAGVKLLFVRSGLELSAVSYSGPTI